MIAPPGEHGQKPQMLAQDLADDGSGGAEPDEDGREAADEKSGCDQDVAPRPASRTFATSSMVVPAIKVRYGGTRGSTHGLRNDKRPASAAAGSVTSCVISASNRFADGAEAASPRLRPPAPAILVNSA